MPDFTDFDFTSDQLTEALPNCKDPIGWYEQLVAILPQYQINTIARVSAFLAECAVESADFNVLEENLNYSKEGLRRVFPKYFSENEAASFARKPERIANRVYANRMGNGPESSGEGWMYRGRGLIQLTGRNNYRECSQFMFQDDTLLDSPDLLTDQYYAIHSACWYWTNRKLNELADEQNISLISKKINGGPNGLAERIAHYNHIVEALQA